MQRRIVRHVYQPLSLRSLSNYMQNRGKILPCIPFFQSVDPEESPVKYMQHWQDISIIKKNGRVFEPDQGLLDPMQTFNFPRVQAQSLYNEKVILPETFGEKPVKVLAFSLSKYGERATATWMEPVLQRYGPNHPHIQIFELFFMEWKFLSFFQQTILNTIKSQKFSEFKALNLKEDPEKCLRNVGVSFGDVLVRYVFVFSAKEFLSCIVSFCAQEFAKAVRLPNKYTGGMVESWWFAGSDCVCCVGYVCLLDRHNRVRWRACGVSNAAQEIDLLLRCIEQLSKEK